jgi:hypothetical protein
MNVRGDSSAPAMPQSRHLPSSKAASDGSEQNICCGQPLELRLARIRDRQGDMIFVAVCRCPRCGRVIAER